MRATGDLNKYDWAQRWWSLRSASCSGDFVSGAAEEMPTEATPLKSAPSASAPSPAALFADEKSTAFHAFINELKCLIGVGSLTLPFVTEQFGLFASLTGVLLLCYAAWEGIRLLIYCVAHDRRQRKSSLPGGGDDGSEGAGAWRNVSEAAFGPVGWWLTLLSLVMAQLGVATSYIDQTSATVRLFFGLEEGPTLLL